ncbi:MAG: hypothetical protein K1X64_21115 [Myxococcaceae bacterium]|nr:hypothetical protein [Myxococcaceae bacterium]
MKQPLLAVCTAALFALTACSGSPGNDAGTGGGTGTGGGATGTGGGMTGTGGGTVAAGDCNWSVRFGSLLTDLAYDLLVLNDGSAVVVGVVGAGLDPKDAGSERGALAARISKQGEVMWKRAYGGGTAATNVILAQDGNLWLGGYAGVGSQGCTNHHGGEDVWLAKVRLSDGEALFKTCIGGDDDEEMRAFREVVLDGGVAVHMTGETDSHQNGDVGPKHGGGGFDAPDMMSAFVFLDGGTHVACFGTNGPDIGTGFLDDGSLVGSTFGDDTGDLMGQPLQGYADLMLARWPNGNVCTEKMCSVEATRIGGDSNEAISQALPGNTVVGETRSTDGGVKCATASASSARIFVAHVSGNGFDKFKCLETPTENGVIRAVDAVRAGNQIIVAISDLQTGGDFAGATPIDAGTQTSANGNTVLTLDADSMSITRRIHLRGVEANAIAQRADGCLLVSSRTSSGSDINITAIAP